ncbi:MAG: hypothetical protein JRJ19_00910 [Deltaproteobacteria bacterium]|nr:hypothetical protein [Deltaproteobacteria bacterium]
MKKAIFPLLLAIGAAVIATMVTNWTVSAKAEAEGNFKAGLLSMQVEFLKNNSVLRPIVDMQKRPDLQKYLQEANTLVNWYFKNPAAKFWENNPGKYDPERIIKEKRQRAADEGPNKRKAKGNLPIWEECYQITRTIYDQFKQSNYAAVASAFNGSVRLDVHSVKKDGNKLRWEIMIWGGIGPIVYGGWNLKWFKSPSAEEKTAYEKELARAKRRRQEPELEDPATLHFAESASASKHPVFNFTLEGSDYVDDFPPGIQLNYYTTPPCPPDAEILLMTFSIKSRAMSGQDQNMTFEFKIPVNSSWKGSWDGVQKVEAAADYGNQ